MTTPARSLSSVPVTPAECIDKSTRLEAAAANAVRRLLAERLPAGYWEGELSSSALSTATAVCALRDFARVLEDRRDEFQQRIERGLAWLERHQNQDGGWGDTILSLSNISTTALVWGALAGKETSLNPTIRRCEDWLAKRAGGLEPEILAHAIRLRYGKDHTFSVPILTALALSGRLGPDATAWKRIPQLPFELAAFPQSMYAALQMPVVSYALPALIAIGQLRHQKAPSWNLAARAFRNAVKGRTLRLLEQIQPTTGGYLEATPLTSFVVMSLIGAGQAGHPVVQRGLEFLTRSQRDDGSWAIDTNLATWVTTLSVNALGSTAVEEGLLTPEDQAEVRQWLLGQQYRVQHPYTGAAPGGWAWTDLAGGVPDADDTPGALLALQILDDKSTAVEQAACAGVEWLLQLQNRDGGLPTFCRGWGTLPFDRSSLDLTAHALRAWRVWEPRLPADTQNKIRRARSKALTFLRKGQRADGAWTPLWFGNQHLTEEENPVYGTSRVLLALAAEEAEWSVPEMTQLGVAWLLGVQNPDGGWGGGEGTPSSIEETALALEGLSEIHRSGLKLLPLQDRTSLARTLERGFDRLVELTEEGTQFPASPIGFYFAKLWYFEKLYPLVYSVAAFRRGRGLVPTQVLSPDEREAI